MDNAYDQAHKLARAIKASREYKTYAEKRKALNADSKNKKMVEDFQEKAMKLQVEQMSGKELKPEDVDKVKKLEELLMLNPTISEYLQAELRFSQLFQDISKIIGDAIDIKE